MKQVTESTRCFCLAHTSLSDQVVGKSTTASNTWGRLRQTYGGENQEWPGCRWLCPQACPNCLQVFASLPNPPSARPTLRPTTFKWAGLCRAESTGPQVTRGKASLTTGTFPKKGDINIKQQGAGWQLLQTALSGSREPATLLQATTKKQ